MAIPPQEVSAECALVSWPEPDIGEDTESAADASLRAATLRIRQLELVGFKSFRDRVVLRFDEGVIGIVGPNGCGKSNVVDAIRWVLGEQSAKRLRGQGMEDVVFGGNDRHAPLGMAQVSIVFECDGLPVDQYALLQESGHPIADAGPADIMVTRRYYRSGESEYLMNGLPCRLRDITELFLGTGVGSKAYAIIEQGRVEQLVGAKPDELRLFIEEAAGTTLYRSRRQVAERKMERTQENLERVRDILREVDRQLGGLRRQAKRAEQYRALQTEIAALDLALSRRQRARLAQDLARLERERADTGMRQSEVEDALARVERQRREARSGEASAQERASAAQASAFEARTAFDECRHEVARLAARATELAAQDAATARDLEEARAAGARASAERTSVEDSLAALAVRIAAAEEALAAREGAAAAAAAAFAAAACALEEAKVAVVDALADETRARNAQAALESRRQEDTERRGRLATQAAALTARQRGVEERARMAEQTVVELQKQLESVAGAKRERSEELRRLLEERASWDATLDGMKEALARVRSRRDSLRQLEDSHAGYGEGVRAVLAASSHDEALGLVAEVLEIPADHERAVAAALGEYLQAVVTRDHEVARDAVQALRRAGAGRATCIPRQPRPPAIGPIPTGARRLLDVIGVRPGYEDVAEALLANVVLAPDLDTALTLWRANGGAWTLVTPSGETIDATGAVAGGSERAEETLLAERRELRALDQEVDVRARDLAGARVRQEELATAVVTREGGVRELDAELARITVAVVASEKDVERAGQEHHDLDEQLRALRAEIEMIDARLRELAAEGERLAADLSGSETQRLGLERELALIDERRCVAERHVVTLQESLTEARIALAEERTRTSALASLIERLRQTDEEAGRRAMTLEARRTSDARVLAETREIAAARTAELGIRQAAANTRAAEVTEATQAVAGARAAAEAAERGAAGIQTELEALRARAAALQLQAAERRLAIEHLEATLGERYGAMLGDAAAAAPTDDAGGADDAAHEERLGRLRERLAAMGEVNVAALSEVAELKERQQFLDTQRADLERALDDLKKTIARLNRTSRARFRETFDRVDATFQEVFPKLFQGGKARLRLTEEEHLLESGVEIVVQPPGKRVGSLDLLSGGEKALTAVSLIFALFLIKPSPFCVLDEVDAPLDDANIGRFNLMVREMSARSQFILITHNKCTMEVAQTLYGITMEEPGVSKIVSVRLPD
ncbi:MAG: chromosome segregation protein SMC [Deltaproteobacteria bacterium]|nr:chromosome segregation protein SMC [Deltaproteobacteria bacterium]